MVIGGLGGGMIMLLSVILPGMRKGLVQVHYRRVLCRCTVSVCCDHALSDVCGGCSVALGACAGGVLCLCAMAMLWLCCDCG